MKVLGNVKYLGATWKLLWNSDRKRVIYTILHQLFQTLFVPFILVLSKFIIDGITGGNTNQTVLLGAAGVFAVMQIVNDGLAPYQQMNLKLLTASFTRKIDQLLMQKANSFPGTAPFETAEIHTQVKVFQTASYSTTIWLDTGFRTIGAFILLITISGLLGSIVPWAPLVLIAVSLPKTVIDAKLNNVLYEGREELQEKRRRTQYLTDQSLNPAIAHETKLFNLVPFFKEKFTEQAEDLVAALSGDQKKWARHRFTWGAIEGAVVAGILGYLVYSVWQGQAITAGDIALFVTTLFQMNAAISQLFSIFALGGRELNEMKKLVVFLESEPEMTEGTEPVPTGNKEGFSLENVVFSYDGRDKILDIDHLNIPAGKVTALVGENGAGKTTLVNLLCRFYDPNEGVVKWEGKDLKAFRTSELREKFTGVFQHFNRYELTALENVMLGNPSKMKEAATFELALEYGGASKLISGLPEKEHTLLGRLFGGQELSGGQWQRIALARAFSRMQEAEIIILDEPTAALDAKIEAELFNRMAELGKGKTVILISHRLTTINMADNIVFLEKGKVVEEGTHTELMRKGEKYAELFQMQARSYEITGQE